MRIKVKLISTVLLLTVLPIIIVTVIANNTIIKSTMNSQIAYIENTLKNQADDINYVFEDIVSLGKSFVSSENIKTFTELSNGDGFSSGLFESELQDIQVELKSILSLDSSLQKAMIINNSGTIIASTDLDDIGKLMSNAQGLLNLALENNGFSSFYINNESGSNIPMFVVSKSIYSAANERQGIFYQQYNTSSLQKFLGNMKLDKYSGVAIMDSGGNILEHPFKVIRHYTENSNFSSARENIKSIIDGESTVAKNTMVECGPNNDLKLFYNSQIPNSNWTLLSITNKYSLQAEFKKAGAFTRNFSIIMLLLIIAAVVLFAFIFTKPIDDIIKVLIKKQKGDQNARFTIQTKDEFNQIGDAFNKMFDDVFESEQRYRTIVEMTNNIIFEISFKKDNVYISKNFNKKFSLRPKDDTLKESFFYKLRIHKDDKERYNSDLDKILGSSNFWQGDYRIKNIYGDFGWVMIKGTKFYDRDDVPTKIVGVIVDIDREKKSEMHLLQRASYDALTQLFNRETFLKSLAAEFEMSLMKKSLDALMFIDLDDFKFFNDEYGHACGDEVLKFVADTLKEITFERGFSGRFGGDEFVICLTNLTLYGDSGKIAQEIIDVLGKGFTFNFEGKSVKMVVRCSIGIAFLRESGKNCEEIIAAADEAMYNIKKHGKSAYAYAKSAAKTSLETSEANIIDASEIDEFSNERASGAV